MRWLAKKPSVVPRYNLWAMSAIDMPLPVFIGDLIQDDKIWTTGVHIRGIPDEVPNTFQQPTPLKFNNGIRIVHKKGPL